MNNHSYITFNYIPTTVLAFLKIYVYYYNILRLFCSMLNIFSERRRKGIARIYTYNMYCLYTNILLLCAQPGLNRGR